MQHSGEWSESLAISGPEFVDEIKAGSGVQRIHRYSVKTEEDHVLKEPPAAYETIYIDYDALFKGK